MLHNSREEEKQERPPMEDSDDDASSLNTEGTARNGGGVRGSRTHTQNWDALNAPSIWYEEDDACYQYAEDVHAVLRENEIQNRPLENYMGKVQQDINHNMRSILVDWLVEVAEEYKLSTQTLFLTVNYIDRLLSRCAVNRNRLQLLGITSMFVAAKYEEIYPPTIKEFVYISDNTYNREQVLTMESLLLRVLKFRLTGATPWEFIKQLFKASKLDQTTSCLAHYVMELFLLDAAYLKFYPSVVAGAAILLASWTLEHEDIWSETLMRVCGYTAVQLLPCAKEMERVYIEKTRDPNSTKLKAVREKFRDEKYRQVAKIQPREPKLHLSGQ